MIEGQLNTRLVQFSWAPASYVDPSWLSRWIAPAVFERIRTNPDAARTLNQFLLEELDLRELVTEEVGVDPLLKLLLLPGQAIRRVVLYMGLTLRNQRIKQIICGKAQRDLREQIGEDAFQYALKRAQFMVGPLESQLCLNRMPIPQEASLRSELEHAGLLLLALATMRMDPPVQNRFLLKLSTSDAESVRHCWELGFDGFLKDTTTPDKIKNLMEVLIIKIVQELYPQW